MPNPADRFYGSPAWKAARRAALRRDGWRCTVCGVSVAGRGQARVDHIQSLRTRPDLALSLANLRSLCTLHDNQAHREKGRGKAAKREVRFSGTTISGAPLDLGSHWYKYKGKRHLATNKTANAAMWR